MVEMLFLIVWELFVVIFVDFSGSWYLVGMRAMKGFFSWFSFCNLWVYNAVVGWVGIVLNTCSFY